MTTRVATPGTIINNRIFHPTRRMLRLALMALAPLMRLGSAMGLRRGQPTRSTEVCHQEVSRVLDGTETRLRIFQYEKDRSPMYPLPARALPGYARSAINRSQDNL